MAAESAAGKPARSGNQRSWIVYVPDDSGAEPGLTSFLRLGARYDPEAPGALPLAADSEVAADSREPYGVRLQSAGEYSRSIAGPRFGLTSERGSGEPVELDYTRQTAAKTSRSTSARLAHQEHYSSGERLDFHQGQQISPQLGLEIAPRVGGSLKIGQALAEVSIADTTMTLEAGEGAASTGLPRLGRSLVEAATSELRAAERISLSATPAAVAASLEQSRTLAATGRTAMLAINAVFAAVVKGLAGRRGEQALKDTMERSQAVVALALGIYGLLHMIAVALGIQKMVALREAASRLPGAGIHLTPDGVMLYSRSAGGTATLTLSGGRIALSAPVGIDSAAPGRASSGHHDGAMGERLLRHFERSGG